jgi:hypothetical protein
MITLSQSTFKKPFFQLLVFLGFSCFASTESFGNLSPLSFGAKAGLGLGKLSVENISSDFKTNYLLGVGTDIGLGPVGVLADVLYAQRNFDAGNQVSWGIKRLEIPVQARMSMGLVRAQAGLYWAKVLGDIKQTSAAGVESSVTQANAGIDGTDTGLIIGVGAKFAVVSVEARYLFGLKNISSTTGTSRTSSFDLVLGVWF